MFTRPTVTNIPHTLTTKWSEDILSEGFVPLPKKFVRCLSSVFVEPSYERLQLIMAIVDYIRPNLSNPPSVEYLAFTAGLTPERCKTCLDDLKNAGLIDYDGHDIALTVNLDGLKSRIRQKTRSGNQT